MEINWSLFKVVAFIDSNVALECLALEQLPWSNIHNTGPILVLVTPTVLQEVDAKKNHARLGDHARRFNRKMRPLLGEQATVVIRQSPLPQVEVALADCCRVDWQKYPDLDPDEPDSRIVAQALSARGPSQEDRVVISQDIRPLHLAKQHGLRTYHMGENWLRPKEIPESEKKASALHREIEAMKSRQPDLALLFKAKSDSVTVHRIRDITAQKRQQIQDTIILLHPMPEQTRNSLGISSSLLNDYDHSLSDRYKRWEDKIIPQFMLNYERKLELNFGQLEIIFHIKNVGQVPAESLLIHLTAEGGWINNRYVLANPTGPGAPRIRQSSLHMNFRNHIFRPVAPPGKHEFVVQKDPKRSTDVQISCSDFRHGFDYEYRMIGWADPHADSFRLTAVVTAANLYGEIQETFTVEKTVIDSNVHNLLEAKLLNFQQPPEIFGFLIAAKSKSDYADFEFDGSDWDE